MLKKSLLCLTTILTLLLGFSKKLNFGDCFTIVTLILLTFYEDHTLVNSSNRNSFRNLCNLYSILLWPLLTFFRWLRWYSGARFYVVIKIIHGFWIKVSYKEKRKPQVFRGFLLLFDLLKRKYIDET